MKVKTIYNELLTVNGSLAGEKSILSIIIKIMIKQPQNIHKDLLIYFFLLFTIFPIDMSFD